MQYKFIFMKEDYANEIAYNWRYNGIYSFYDIIADEEDLNEFIDKENWKDTYFAVLNEDDHLVGFYSFTFDEGIMWIGFGLKPELTGVGLGMDFVTAGINFGVKNFNYGKNYIMLAVAAFNKRAIRLYKRIGFQITEEYMQQTNGAEYKFVKMKKTI